MEPLITFELAKLAKEKGFNYPTDNHYEYYFEDQIDEEYGTSGPFGWKKGETNLQSGYMINNHEKIDFSNENWALYSAPSHAWLQKWLRDEHNLHIDIVLGHDEDNIWYDFFVFTIEKGYNFDEITSSDCGIDTYEEALEAGLYEALNLIEE